MKLNEATLETKVGQGVAQVLGSWKHDKCIQFSTVYVD